MKRSLLYDSIIVNRKPPINYDTMVAGKEKFIHFQETLSPVYSLDLENVYISPYGIVFKNGKVVKESIYSMLLGYNHNLTFYKKIILGKVRKVNGPCLVAHNLYFNNYYHWTMEALPRIFSVRERTRGLKILIPHGSPTFVHEYLKFFEFEDVIEVFEDELIKADSLVLPMHLAPGLRHNPIVIRELRDFLLARIDQQNNTFPTKIWVSRQNARYRQSPDEDRIIGLLSDRGFENIRLEEWNLRDQIRLFAGLEILSGIHGAGFTNSLFMKNGGKIIDFIHEKHPDDAFYNLSAIHQIAYYFIQCKGTGKQSYVNNDDLYLKENEILSLID
ncbi:MAG: glycosyltransferase family 61 protein [Cytophagales bacterium]|nr:glycosyltransferase family 61 protein [Cytophagales bacterium]